MPRRLPEEKIREAQRLSRSGLNSKNISVRLGVNPSQISRWKKTQLWQNLDCQEIEVKEEEDILTIDVDSFDSESPEPTIEEPEPISKKEEYTRKLCQFQNQLVQQNMSLLKVTDSLLDYIDNEMSRLKEKAEKDEDLSLCNLINSAKIPYTASIAATLSRQVTSQGSVIFGIEKILNHIEDKKNH